MSTARSHRVGEDRPNRKEATVFVNTMPRYEILSEEAMATLDEGWRRLVTEIGVEFMSDRALDLFRAGGPEGRGQHGLPRPRVRPRAGRQGAARVRRAGAQPRQQRAHRRRRDGLRRVYGPPFVREGDVRRDATIEDFRNFTKLAQSLLGPGLRRRRRLRAQRHPARLAATST